jgi:hypothetical protein
LVRKLDLESSGTKRSSKEGMAEEFTTIKQTPHITHFTRPKENEHS